METVADCASIMGQLHFINGWLSGPFHRPRMLDPRVHKVGFGEVCEGLACAAGLDAPEARRPSAPQTFAHPVLFPPPKYPIALIELATEWPDPTTACPGYPFPVGIPITIELGIHADAKLSAYALKENSHPVEACGYDWSTYVNPNPDDQKRARDIMHSNGEVVIVPRKPLERGATYAVSATVNGQPFNWSFTVSK